jgi:sterol desaturase/sphingolipid hydroxylase (fatty acid hydroxylase superfamily)
MGLFRTTAAYDEALANWEGIGDRPAPGNLARRDGIRVLENDLPERYLTSAHWTLPGLWALPLVAFCLHRALVIEERPGLAVTGLFLAGVLGWTITEYWLHRWLFHLPPARGRTLRAIQFGLHGYHHEFPEDPRRLVAPPILAIPIASTLAGLVVLLSPGHWAPLLAGTFFGYLCYDWVHYYSHHGRPRTAAGRFLRRFHKAHHYRCATSRYGLSSPLWDLVFRTHDDRPTGRCRAGTGRRTSRRSGQSRRASGPRDSQ